MCRRVAPVLLLCCVLWPHRGFAEGFAPKTHLADCYEPIQGGWRLRIANDPAAPRPTEGSRMGVVSSNAAYSGNPRLHRRPLYPPADRALLFSSEELGALERSPFRPLVLAYNEPRFLFDYHSAGGLLGHLYLGLVLADGTGKWLHEWSDIDVSYVDGRMEYTLTDSTCPGATINLQAVALARAAGLIVKVSLSKMPQGSKLVWAYGGASAFFTNWAMNAPEFEFSPPQCERDRFTALDGGFELTRAFAKPDVILNEVFAVPRKLPEWKAHIRGGSSWKGRGGFGSPAAFKSPATLTKSADWTASGKSDCVFVEQVDLDESADGYIIVGMGHHIAEDLAAPDEAWRAARARNDAIARRLVVHTPDPYLNAAATMMAFATEGTWGDVAVLHGGWSWRYAYMGWRGWYGMNAYGWTDRIKTSIQSMMRLNHIKDGPDAGAFGSLLEYDPGVYYNMNEVFLDQVRHYFDYTGDLPFMEEVFPKLEGVLAWEERRLRPTDEPLFENALNTWCSDQHWYIRGQCTQASAYMLGAYGFMADLSARLGKDPAPFKARAEAIHHAMQDKLWMARRGVYAEYLDTRGHKLLHPEPELATLYHAAEFGATDSLQTWQMVDWAATHLGHVATPQGGRLYWSSNWFPNMGRSYTHSTYEMAYAEELNFALTHYLAGRADEAYALQRACLAGIFNGMTPGGLACHSYVDGRQRGNDEFSDAISMWGRCTVEGLFGILPRRGDGAVELCPQFPSEWREASIMSSQLSFRYRRKENVIAIDWTAPQPTVVRLRLPLRAISVEDVTVDDLPATFRTEPGVGITWLRVDTPSSLAGNIEVACHEVSTDQSITASVRQGEAVRLHVPDALDGPPLDPQGLLTGGNVQTGWLEGTATGEPGHGVLFLRAGTDLMPRYLPVRLVVEPVVPALTPRIWTPPAVAEHDLSLWTVIPLDEFYNASLTEAMRRVWEATTPPPPPSTEISTAYYKDHLVEPFVTPPPSDEAWRSKIGDDGIGWTRDGIPFHAAKSGPNIAVVTRAAAFPSDLAFPVGAQGKTLYLMLSGTTFAMQSHVPNLRVTLHYADGESKTFDMVNPFDIGDCWNQYRYHDTAANGFENLGGRSGPAGSRDVLDMTQPVAVDTEAHLVAFDLKADMTLDSVRLEAIANDVIFGVMGATILK